MKSDARKAAEAWLAEHDGAAWCRDVAPILRALLAEQGAGGASEDGRVPVTVSRRSDDAGTIAFDGSSLTTARACRNCGVLIVGGPTCCLYCADRATPGLCSVCRRPLALHRHGGACSCRDCCNRPLPLDGDGRDGHNGLEPFEG